MKDDRLELEEIHRFPNDPVQIGERLHWDILRLYYEMEQGLSIAARNHSIQSIGIDSWAVDFGLLSKEDELLGNPIHYRDPHTNGMMEEVFSQIAKRDIFAKTGIQFLPFNTIYQLAALRKRQSSWLQQAESLLMIPDLLRFFLTGEKMSEYTNATTTQLFHAKERRWDLDMIRKLQIPSQLFQQVIEPGTVIGSLRQRLRDTSGLQNTQVVAVAEHDTASAVAAVPAETAQFAYLSCGTWSLLGTEIREPLLNEEALRLNFTNEGGVGGTFRLLKNIMGLWLLEQCRRAWDRAGRSITYDELLHLADQAKPFRSLFDPDHPSLLNPASMPDQIVAVCKDSGQVPPTNPGEFVRAILESLALKYRYVLESTERLTNVVYPGLHIVGGGIRNERLCQYTANAIGRPVWAGPVESSSIGNLLLQMIAGHELHSIEEARQLVRRSFPIRTYEPEHELVWNETYERFVQEIVQRDVS